MTTKTKIIIKNSNVPGKIPTPTDLEVAEFAVNLANKKIFSKEPGGTIVELGGGGVTPKASKSEIFFGTEDNKFITPKGLASKAATTPNSMSLLDTNKLVALNGNGKIDSGFIDIGPAATQAAAGNHNHDTRYLPLTGGEISDTGEKEVDHGNVTRAVTLNAQQGLVHTATMTANTTFTLQNPTGHDSVSLLFLVTTGGFSPTFTGVTWMTDITPLGSVGTYLMGLFLINSSWYGVLAQ